jgi:hypothetical protein
MGLMTTPAQGRQPASADHEPVWTVLGVWVGDEAVPIGAIHGQHEVHGENPCDWFPEGVWATSVDAPDEDAAYAAARAEMHSTLSDGAGDDDEQLPGT